MKMSDFKDTDEAEFDPEADQASVSTRLYKFWIVAFNKGPF